MTFEFCELHTATALIDIDDVFNCCIKAVDLVKQEYYLAIHTNLGVVNIIEYGPIIPDIKEMPDNLIYSYQKLDSNMKFLIKRIEAFLNNPRRSIVTACLIDLDEFKKIIRNPIDHIDDV